MLAPTHSVFGVFLTLIFLAVFGVQWGLHWTIILLAALGSILPDIDHPRSVIGRLFPFISVPLERRYGHRTLTHSLVGWVLSTILFALLVLTGVALLSLIPDLLPGGVEGLLPRWIAAFSIGYFSHLLLDMFNRRGSQMFWPDSGRDVIPKNSKLRPESGSRAEPFIFLILLGLMFLALPISKYGIPSSLRWLLATPGSAIEEFKSLKTHAYLEFKGIMGETRQPVSGQAQILDVRNKRLVILYNDQVYTLSDELAADIFASHVRVKKTTLPIKMEKRVFSQESREALLSQIPAGALVSGVVQLPQGMEITFPSFPGSYKTMEQKGGELLLSFASRDKLAGLALTEYFDLQRKKDQAELSGLRTRSAKLRSQINELRSSQGLTPLGQQLLLSQGEAEKQQTQIAELTNQLEEINVKIEELQIKMKARKFVFSGEVYLRQ